MSKASLFLVNLTAVILVSSVVSGCGRRGGFKSASAAAPAPLVSPSPSAGAQSAVTATPSFAKIRVQETTQPMPGGYPAVIQELENGTYVVKEEELFNPTDDPVVLWLHGSGTSHVYSEYPSFHRVQTGTDFSLTSVRVSYFKTGRTETQGLSGWVTVQLGAHDTVRLEWIAAKNFGHSICPSHYGQDNGPGIGAVYDVELTGSLLPVVRAAAFGTPEQVATMSSDQLYPDLVMSLEASPVSMNASWGSRSSDVFVYYCWDGR